MELFTQQFEEMYKAHYPALRNTAQNILSDSETSHDIVQEVFLKLWRKGVNPAYMLNQRAYLFKAVVNASITHLHKNKHNIRISQVKTEAAEQISNTLEVKELEENIQQALDKLPAKCKSVFVLSRFEGMKNKDIAIALGISLKTVENQMGIALKKMRDELKHFIGSEFISTALGSGLAVLSQLLFSCMAFLCFGLTLFV